MHSICWLTDIHLDHLRRQTAPQEFGQQVRMSNEFESVIVTGDIAEAGSLHRCLNLFAQGVGPDKPVYFILGNHDYYGSSMAVVPKSLDAGLDANVIWLERTPIYLDSETALVGKYAWYDAALGLSTLSQVELSDFHLVRELRTLYARTAKNRVELMLFLHDLAVEAAKEACSHLLEALQHRKRVIFATHVPPFEGSAWHDGELSNGHWLPWMTCNAMGVMLLDVASDYPDSQILVLCGHTHSEGIYQPLPNLRVLTGRGPASLSTGYGPPVVAGVFSEQVWW